jgi:NitT/TauT family transport system ATP-binding protein
VAAALDVTLHEISLAFHPGQPVLDRLSLQIAPGQFTALVGASGSGKSTLLRLVAGLLRPDAGSVLVPSEYGLMFQQPRLLAWRTVLENVLLSAELRGLDRRDRALELLELARIGHLVDRRPSQLSGGEQQRAALVRALLLTPKLLLLDEPFAALDAMTREELHLELLRLLSATGTTCLLVTHDIAEAAFLADRVLLMAGGRIHKEFQVELPRPRLTDHRYSPELALLCRSIRLAMEEVRGLG